MSQRIKKNLPTLRMLCGAKPALIKAVLKTSSPDLIYTLSECCLNILKGHVRLTPAQKKQLARYKQSLRTLVKKSTPIKTKKRLLQKGGLLPLLLKPALAVLGGLLSGGL